VTTELTELVEREAAEAEAEFPEPVIDPLTGGELPSSESAEPERQEVPTVARTDEAEREKKLKGEDTRHENALKKIWGDEFAEKAYCPTCLGQGFLSPWPEGAMPDEVWEAVKALCGQVDAGQFRHPDELVMCERCDGEGRVETGAKNEHNLLIPCKLCDSRGYFDLSDGLHRGKLGLHEPAPQFVAPAPFTQWPALTPEAPVQTIAPPDGWAGAGKPGADQYGRWPGHPRFGIDPAMNGGQW
jgi:hypothetical protein